MRTGGDRSGTSFSPSLLAELDLRKFQVLDVVRKMSSLRKISFLAHSLGGLFARYAISLLYSSETNTAQSGAHSSCLQQENLKSQNALQNYVQ
jgi:hypothetical protein